MTYHDYSEENIDFQGIEEAAHFIGTWLIKWVRMPVRQTKEKFGTARVYCSFGWWSFYSIWRPQFYWVPKWYPWRLDLWISYQTPLFTLLNKVIIPFHKWAYQQTYKQAINKWPHLRNEILDGADWPEELKGL